MRLFTNKTTLLTLQSSCTLNVHILQTMQPILLFFQVPLQTGQVHFCFSTLLFFFDKSFSCIFGFYWLLRFQFCCFFCLDLTWFLLFLVFFSWSCCNKFLMKANNDFRHFPLSICKINWFGDFWYFLKKALLLLKWFNFLLKISSKGVS